MDTRMMLGGTSLVLLTSAAAAIQVAAPALLPVLCPLSLAVGGAAYLAARPDTRARIAGVLSSPPPRLLPDHAAPVTPDPSSSAPPGADLHAQVLAALTQPVPAPVPILAVPTHDHGFLDTLLAAPLVAAPARTPRCAALPLEYAPGMAERWMASVLPLSVLESATAYSDHTPRALLERLHDMLTRGALIISRTTLGCALHEADQRGDWTAVLLICDRAPDAVLHDRLLAHFAALAVQPYSRGGVALLVVLAHPFASFARAARRTPFTAAATHGAAPHVASVPLAPAAETRVSALRAATDAPLPAPRDTPATASDRDCRALQEADDHAAASAATGALDPEVRDAAPLRSAARPVLPAPEHFVAAERGRRPQSAAPPADLATAQALWTPGANLPQLHFGVHPTTGALITGPLEPTCFFVPTQRGKTTLLMYLLHQALLARDPSNGDGLATWFLTTKWQDTTTHGVQIGRWLRHAYNLAHFDAPRGIEPDGRGTYRMLLLLEQELNARLTPGSTQPRTPILGLVDEWAYTVAVLGHKRFKQAPRRASVAAVPDMDDTDPWALEDDAPKTPLDAASLAVKRLIRQGFGERMVLFLVTQDGQVQNNGALLNTGVLGSFSTYLCHTESDPQTFKIIAKGDSARLEHLTALRRDWQGWIYVREHTILPLTFPHVTNTTIDQWLADVAPPAAPGLVAPHVPVTPAALCAAPPESGEHSVASRLADWPESVRNQVARVPPEQLQALIAAFARIGVTIPMRVSDAARAALLGLGAPEEANERLLALISALASKAQPPMSFNQLGALVFGRTGQASADLRRAVHVRLGNGGRL